MTSTAMLYVNGAFACAPARKRRFGFWAVWAAGLLFSCNFGGSAEKSAARDTRAPIEKALPAKVDSVRIFHRSLQAMGTIFTCSAAVTDQEEDLVSKAVDAAFAEILRIEKMMSVHLPDSPISEVNRHAGERPVTAPSELIKLIDESLRISARTEGKFDISFGPMGRLWHFDEASFSIPKPSDIEAAGRLVDYKSIVTDAAAGTVFLKKKGMSISLGAVAKGYAVDRAASVLKARGIVDFIVYGGGDIFVSGRKGEKPWRVGIQDPRNRRAYFADLDMPRGGAVVTSGDYEKFVTVDARRYHHIIDPSNGFPARGTVSVTVFAKSTARADALATGIFVLGVQKGMALIESDPTIEGVLVDDRLVSHVSSGLKNKIAIRPVAGARDGSL